MTGATITAPDAQALTDEIREDLETMADAYKRVVPKIARAFEAQAWVALGYRKNQSAAWLQDNFSEALGKLRGGVRQEMTQQLVQDVPEISTRGVAALTGVSHETAAQDKKPVRNLTVSEPDPEVIDAEIVEEYTTPTEESEMSTATAEKANPRRALTDAQEAELVRKYEAGATQSDLSREFDVDRSTIPLVLARAEVVIRDRKVERANHGKQMSLVAADLRGLTYGLSTLDWLNGTVTPELAARLAPDLIAAAKEINRIAGLLKDRSKTS